MIFTMTKNNVNSVKFIVNNSRLEGLYHTEDEVKRIENVVTGKISVSQAIEETIALHYEKYGKHV